MAMLVRRPDRHQPRSASPCTSVAMVAVMGAVAFFVYERVGLQILRRAWLNTDQVWAGAFVLAGLVTLTS